MIKNLDMNLKIAVVIPTYMAKDHVLDVIDRVPESVDKIIVVDDCCPQKSGEHVKQHCNDPRVKVISLGKNLGVGGAVLQGFQYAYDNGQDVFVKIDSDGQIDPALVDKIIPIFTSNAASYVKGSRFTKIKDIGKMPKHRVILNAILSFTNKFSSGYYSINDPTNGFIAIKKEVFADLPKAKVSNDFFFESDMLYHLNLNRVKVLDVPMNASYGEEDSNLKFKNEAWKFARGNVVNFFKRVFIRHFVINFSIPAIYFLFGILFIVLALVIGFLGWYASIINHHPATAGTVMIPALLAILGMNFLTSFLLFDVNDEPKGDS